MQLTIDGTTYVGKVTGTSESSGGVRTSRSHLIDGRDFTLFCHSLPSTVRVLPQVRQWRRGPLLTADLLRDHVSVRWAVWTHCRSELIYSAALTGFPHRVPVIKRAVGRGPGRAKLNPAWPGATNLPPIPPPEDEE